MAAAYVRRPRRQRRAIDRRRRLRCNLEETGSGLSVELPFAVNGTIAAVPEPETYAMLLGGLGLIGLARRRARRA